jgi:hypothetical protein
MSFSLKAVAATAIVTLGLAGAAFAATTPAAPIPVAGTPSLTELKLELGLTADMVARGQQLQSDMVKFGYHEDEVDDWCVGKGQIRDGLIRAGFNDMDVVDRLTQFRLRVEALYLADGWVYSMQVNRCTGEVSVIAPIYFAADLD